jgi:hypothetical protein
VVLNDWTDRHASLADRVSKAKPTPADDRSCNYFRTGGYFPQVGRMGRAFSPMITSEKYGEK